MRAGTCRGGKLEVYIKRPALFCLTTDFFCSFENIGTLFHLQGLSIYFNIDQFQLFTPFDYRTYTAKPSALHG